MTSISADYCINICDEKYNSSSGKYQQIEGPPIAKDILIKYYENNEIVKRVLYLISHHHTYDNIDGLDYQVLIEADFLVNLEEEKKSREAIITARDKLFKTDTGIDILNSMLL